MFNKREQTGIQHFKDPKAFVEYQSDLKDVSASIDDYSPNKKCKILVVFDDMVADILSNKKLVAIVIELFIHGGKLNTSIVFVTQSYSAVLLD